MEPSPSGRGSQRTPGLFTPKPSLEALKKPKAFVTIILCVACIILALIATICAAVTIKELNFSDIAREILEIPSFQSVRNTQIRTQVTCAFTFIATTATFGLQFLMIIVIVLNFGFIQQYSIIWLIIQVADGLVCAATFFGLAVAMAVYSGEWREFEDLLELVATLIDNVSASQLTDLFNLDILVPSVGATSAFGFFTTFALISLVAWLVLATFIFKKDEKDSNNTEQP